MINISAMNIFSINNLVEIPPLIHRGKACVNDVDIPLSYQKKNLSIALFTVQTD